MKKSWLNTEASERAEAFAVINERPKDYAVRLVERFPEKYDNADGKATIYNTVNMRAYNIEVINDLRTVIEELKHS